MLFSPPSIWSFRRSECSLVSFSASSAIADQNVGRLSRIIVKMGLPGDLDRKRSSLLELLAWVTSLRPMNTAREGRLAVTAITFERDSSHTSYRQPC
jgi:hypothetical protein